MNPLKHLLITILFCIIYFSFSKWDLDILMGATVLTIMIDVFDHSATILFQNNDLTVQTRRCLRKGDFIQAYRSYYSDRKKYIKFMYLHNRWMLIALLICFGAFVFISAPIAAIILFGPILHFSCDIMENYYYKENMEFWIGKRM